jgi:hypothetical protein
MTAEPDPLPDPQNTPAYRHYLVVCLAALLALLAVLLEKGLGHWSLLPAVLGCLGLAARFRGAPVLVLLSLMWLLVARSGGLDPVRWLRLLVHGQRFSQSLSAAQVTPLDLALTCAVMAYMTAQYRLFGLADNLFPRDARPRDVGQDAPRGPDGEVLRPALQCRSAANVPAGELPRLLVSLPAWCLLGAFGWLVLMTRASPIQGLPVEIWRIALLVWGVGLFLAGAIAGLGYLSQVQATPAEQRLYLQEQLWRQTRGDQRRLNRWLVAARMRRQRREEKS